MKNLRKIVGITLILVIGLAFAACGNDTTNGGGGGGGVTKPSPINLEEAGFDTTTIYSGGTVPTAPANEEQADTAFDPVYSVLEAKYWALEQAVRNYVESRIYAAEGPSINETKNLSEIGFTSPGVSNLSGTVKITYSESQTSGSMTVTVNASYDYDSKNDTSYSKYTGKRLVAKINATYNTSESGNQSSYNESESLSLASVVAFADNTYCGKGDFTINYNWTYLANAANPDGKYTVNSAGAKFNFYDLEDTQTYTRTLTKAEAEGFLGLGPAGSIPGPYGSIAPQGSIAPAFEKLGLKKVKF